MRIKYLFRYKINSVSICCLPCPPHQRCAALYKAALVVAVVLLLLLPPLSSLLSSSLSSLSSLSLSLSSSSIHPPPCPLLPPPPKKASTRSPQSSAAALPSYIAAAVEHCLHCQPRLPLPSSIAAVKCPRLLSPPTATAVEQHICRCFLATAVERRQTLLPDQISLLAAAVVHCHRRTPPLIAPVYCAGVSVFHCRCQMLTPATNTCHSHTLTPATTMQGCVMPPTIVVPQSPHPQMRTTSFRGDVSRPPASSVVIAPHLHHPPTAFHCCPQPLLIVKYMFFANCGTFILTHTTPSP